MNDQAITTLRVAARFTKAAGHEIPQSEGDVAFDEQHILTKQQLKAEVASMLGPVDALDIYPADETSARWIATMEDGRTYEGIMTLEATWVDHTVVIVPRVEVVGDLGVRMAADVPRQLLDNRLQEVARRLERLITKVRAEPQRPGLELAGELGEILELAHR